MPKLDNPLAIYKVLPKLNCKLCESPTCLAFAAEVMKGEKLSKCPHLTSEAIEDLEGRIVRQVSPEEQLRQVLVPLKKALAHVDFTAAAERLGAALSGNTLSLKCLGKEFRVDCEGNILSDCHINVWVATPLLNYIVYGAGKELSGKWVTFRELSGETVWNAFFEQRFERPLKLLIDTYPELIEDLIYIFSGKPQQTGISFDISLVLFPLPKVPILVCYTKPKEDLDSKLNIFFDSTANDNLKVDSIYRLCVGLLVMFQKIAARHA